MSLNAWWRDSIGEIFWMEITDRADLSVHLEAPKTKENGDEYWSYSLITECDLGDLVFHYDRSVQAVVVASRVSSRAVDADIVWGALGTSARAKGIKPHRRPGWRVEISDFTRLPESLDLGAMRSKRRELLQVKEALQTAHKGSLYFPFQLRKPLGVQQGYLLKMPADVVRLFPRLHSLLPPDYRLPDPVEIRPSPSRNPDWTSDELILALDLYLRHNPNHINKEHAAVIELSEVLNSLPIHPSDSSSPTFRNPTGVYMKLCNFLRLDPSYEGAGLRAGGQLEEVVWEEYANDPARLAEVVEAIRCNIGSVTRPRDDADTDEDAEAPEGRLLTRVHRLRERNASLVRKKKRQVISDTGHLACEACGFDFAAAYGSLGEGFAECHHLRPVSKLRPGDRTRLADLAIVCANCHRMIHRAKPWLTVTELQSILNEASTTA